MTTDLHLITFIAIIFYGHCPNMLTIIIIIILFMYITAAINLYTLVNRYINWLHSNRLHSITTYILLGSDLLFPTLKFTLQHYHSFYLYITIIFRDERIEQEVIYFHKMTWLARKMRRSTNAVTLYYYKAGYE